MKNQITTINPLNITSVNETVAPNTTDETTVPVLSIPDATSCINGRNFDCEIEGQYCPAAASDKHQSGWTIRKVGNQRQCYNEQTTETGAVVNVVDGMVLDEEYQLIKGRYPSIDEEALLIICSIISDIRKEVNSNSPRISTMVSTRNTLEIAELILDDFTISEAADLLISPFIDKLELNQQETSENIQVMGTSGTVTTLTGLHLSLTHYDRKLVDGFQMRTSDITLQKERLLAMNLREREEIACVGRGRGDLIVAGCAILEAITCKISAEVIHVADRGLREGILTSMMREDMELS